MHSFRVGAVLLAAADKLSQNVMCPGAKPRSPGADWSQGPSCSHRARSLCMTTEETKAEFCKTFVIAQKCV